MPPEILKKVCISCGQKMPLSKSDHCEECLKDFHDQWHVTYYEEEKEKGGKK